MQPFDVHNNFYALSTFPDLKQAVQTYILFEAPLILHFTRLIFGLNILLDLLCEWLTLLPKRTLFPQTEHLAIPTPPCINLSLKNIHNCIKTVSETVTKYT